MSYLRMLENNYEEKIITLNEWTIKKGDYMKLSKDEKLKLDVMYNNLRIDKVIDEKETNTPNVFEEKLLSEVGVIKSILQFFLVLTIISILSSLLMFSQF